MFSLIITIISIALVAALALATLYYGGSAFNKGTVGATAARLINEGQQINGAVQVFKADAAAGTLTAAEVAAVTEVGHLADASKFTSGTGVYMSQLPKDWVATSALAGGHALTKDIKGEVCDEINKRAGLPAPVADAVTANAVYGCVQTAAKADGQFFYKF